MVADQRPMNSWSAAAYLTETLLLSTDLHMDL